MVKPTEIQIDERDGEKVWRYMSFSRFVWLLHKKQLWLSRADLLGNPWEISLSGNQLEHVISRHPPRDILSREGATETAIQRSERIIKLWRREAFVNCGAPQKMSRMLYGEFIARPTKGSQYRPRFLNFDNHLTMHLYIESPTKYLGAAGRRPGFLIW